ncbi:MAG: 3-oxo-5-alpha-steroid 4-dehydrogenase [Hyphomonadaceae bacterium]
MPSLSVYETTCYVLFALGGMTLISLIFVTAPYGRYERKNWGPEMNERLGWMLMEIVSPAVFLVFLFKSGSPNTVALILTLMYCGHYAYRALIYPLRMKGTGTKPVATVAMACLFNALNGAVNGWAAGHAAHLDAGWLSAPWLWIGMGVFAGGMALNHWSDHILRNLRGPGETGYKIPYGGPFRYVTAPNYLGEIIEWTGFAIAACTLGAWSFAFFTAANIGPRAFQHHRWYKETFPDYPTDRKALVPFIV